MRGRRLILSAVTMLVAVLGLPSAAHAASPPIITSLNCASLDELIVCSVDYTAEGVLGVNHQITWLNGVLVRQQGNNQSILSFRCFAGVLNNTPYEVTVQVRNSAGTATLTRKDVLCDGTPLLRKLGSIFCQPSPSALAGLPGGNYILCDIIWVNDGSPMTVRWVSPQANRQPVVTTVDRMSQASFNCNNPGGPDLTFYSYVVVTDAAGSMTTPATIPCGW